MSSRAGTRFSGCLRGDCRPCARRADLPRGVRALHALLPGSLPNRLRVLGVVGVEPVRRFVRPWRADRDANGHQIATKEFDLSRAFLEYDV